MNATFFDGRGESEGAVRGRETKSGEEAILA